MKKIFVGFAALAAIFTAGTLAGCASTNATSSGTNAQPTPESGITVAGMESTIIDWDGRGLNEPAIPTWLGPAKRGDYSAYITTFKKPDGDVYRNSTGMGADVRSATMRADMAYARKIAFELRTQINTFGAEQAQAGNITDATREAIENVTKTQSDAEITGHQKAAEFWQRIVTTDPVSGEKSSQYIVYQIYQIPANTWAQTAAKYVRDVIGQVPEETSPQQDFVRGLIQEMMHDARFPTVMSQEQAKQSAEYNKQMADVQVDNARTLAPAQQKAAADQALIEIVQKEETERARIVADARSAQTQAAADAAKIAYASGNPVFIEAAGITAADKDWADAEALAAAILFN